MNPQTIVRAGWLKLSLLLVLAAGSLGGGYYLATAPVATNPNPDAGKTSAPSTHRFALTAADAKERMESTEVGVDAVGRVYLTWASLTGPEERALLLTRSDDAVAMRPMTLEEAIKEAHFKDRDVFVFRDPKGKVMVLHRTRDAKMELIETP